jgi:hypothetical protein
MVNWPKYFPNGCPPTDVEPADGEAFRFLLSSGLTDESFKSVKELKPNKTYGTRRLDCMACGLSFYRSLEVCKKARALIPGFKNKKLAKADLRAEFGVTKMTGINAAGEHHSLWVYPGVLLSSEFVLVP